MDIFNFQSELKYGAESQARPEIRLILDSILHTV